MTEYITKQQADNAINDTTIELYPSEYDELSNAIKRIPAADVAPVVRGKWINKRSTKLFGQVDYTCNRCGRHIQTCFDTDVVKYVPYCHCGAKMDL